MISLDRFNHELTIIQQSLSAWNEELIVRENQVQKENQSIRQQREELIKKSNLILEQVNGLRGQKEQAEQKMIEAERLKKSSIEQLESVDAARVEISLKEDILIEREKNIKLLDAREKKLKDDQEKLENAQIELLKSQTLLAREQELLNEKHQVLRIKEQRIETIQEKQKKIMTGF